MQEPELKPGPAPALVWGARAIGEVIGRSEKQVSYLLERRLLPVRKVGKQWVADRDALLAIGQPET
jgi:hypothetical protein